METRHPLTIPAAIVLGTAVVATALPLPSSTPATATGTAHVTRAYTDKSTHEPGKQATITAEASTGGTVHFSVSHLGVEIDSGDATVTNGKATWAYTTPSENNQGYLVTATGGDGTHAETAIDASTSWTRFPRRGYLSHFKPTAPDGLADNATYEPYLFHAPSDYVTKLSQDYHLNAFQYYDWQYRHEQPVAKGDLKNEWPLWYRDTYAQHLRDQGRRSWRRLAGLLHGVRSQRRLRHERHQRRLDPARGQRLQLATRLRQPVVGPGAPQHAQAPEPHDDDERQQPGLTRLHHWPIRDPEE